MNTKKEMTLTELESHIIEMGELVNEIKLMGTSESRKACNEKRIRQIATRIKCNIPHTWKDTDSKTPLLKLI